MLERIDASRSSSAFRRRRTSGFASSNAVGFLAFVFPEGDAREARRLVWLEVRARKSGELFFGAFAALGLAKRALQLYRRWCTHSPPSGPGWRLDGLPAPPEGPPIYARRNIVMALRFGRSA